jgi:hypothetical protein
MTKIRKFSLAYDAGEDRIAWDAEGVDGGVTRIWLTQRFCREFVGALIARLPKASSADVAPEHEATVQGWEQAAAMSGFGKTPGVRVTAEASVGLVRAVHMTPTRVGLSLAFEFGAGETRSIDLDVAAVRQMLSVMHNLHVTAGWPTAFWPNWISGPVATEAATALN